MNQPDSKQPSRLTRLQLVKRGGLETLPTQEGLQWVNPSRLIENPNNERKTFRNMEGLTASIRKDGIQEPIIVEPAPGQDRFLVVIGARRLRAARTLKLSEVPIVVREARPAAVRRRQSIVSNVQRENVGPVEMAEGLQALLDEDPEIETQRQLAQAIGKDETWVSGILKVLSIPASLRRKLETSQVSIPYDAAIQIARLKDPDAQAEMVQALLDGASVREIRSKVSSINGTTSSTSAEKQPTKKAVYHHEDVDIIVQGKTKKPTLEQQEAALKSALKEVRAKRQ